MRKLIALFFVLFLSSHLNANTLPQDEIMFATCFENCEEVADLYAAAYELNHHARYLVFAGCYELNCDYYQE